jgi:PAS domain S-box-containing protein
VRGLRGCSSRAAGAGVILQGLVLPPETAKPDDAPETPVPPESGAQPGSRGIEAILDPIPGAWFFMRPDGSIAYVSLGACASLGHSRAELRNLTIFDIDPQVTREHWHMLWSKTFPPDALTVRSVHRRKDGTQFPIEVRAVRVYLDGEDLAACYTASLAPSDQTRTALFYKQAELERLVNHAPDLVFRLRTRQAPEFQFISPSSSLLLGYAPEELMASERGLRQVVHADDLAALLALGGQGAGAGQRLRFVHRRGHVVWMELRTTLVLSTGTDEEPGAVIEGIGRDVSVAHEREQRAGQLHQRQKLEAIGQLAGGIAHDFNNLLQVIAGNTQLARAQSRDPELEPLLGGVMTAADRASSLIKQLLAFSRRGSVEFNDVDLARLLSSTCVMLDRLLGKHIRISCECSLPALFVRGNAAQLEQLIVNLAVNARDALPRGGSLRLALAEVPAEQLPALVQRQVTGPSEGYACLTVQDDGDGMSVEVQRRMYEPFFTTKGPGKGTGLGLSTVYAVVQSHAGAIDVVSTPGKGSTFRLFFPRVEDVSAQSTPPPRGARVVGAGRLALAAEDEPEVLRLTANYLGRAGFRVLTAKDGTEAETLIHRHAADLALVVLDVIMPGQSGVSVLNRMRERGYRLPVVLVTGYDDEGLPTAVDPSFTVLRKPFDMDDLLSRIAMVMAAVRS